MSDRIRRRCMYQEDEVAGPSAVSAGSVPVAQAPVGSQPDDPGPSLSPISSIVGDALLQKPEVDLRVRTEVLKTLGSMPGIYATMGIYFSSAHQRMTIVSKKRFLERLPALPTTAGADYAALCLSMNLIIQQPDSHPNGMQSPLYAQLKSIISLLEASNNQSLEVVQCRLLCAFYELGHGIHPAVSVSLGACSRISRFLRLNMQSAPELQLNNVVEEERRRVWWTLANLDSTTLEMLINDRSLLRFVGLSLGDHLLCTQDARIGELLPIDDQQWLQDVIPAPTTSDATLTTSYDVRVGQLARECQVSHLSGRVLRHVFDPTSDSSFQEQEASQLERTLMALMPVLCQEELQFGRYCSALGICSSALYLLYARDKHATGEQDTGPERLAEMEPLSTQITQFSLRLFGGAEEDRDYSTFSPYVPLSLYQSAVVQLRLWKQTGDPPYQDRLTSLKWILGRFNLRWVSAGDLQFYLNMLEQRFADDAAGFYLNALEQDCPALLPHSSSVQ